MSEHSEPTVSQESTHLDPSQASEAPSEAALPAGHPDLNTPASPDPGLGMAPEALQAPTDATTPEAPPASPGEAAEETRIEVLEEPPPASDRIQHDELAILYFEDGKKLTVRAGQGRKGTVFGEVDLAALVGKHFGTAVHTHKGRPVYLLKPTMQDHIMSLKRMTQIIYPKDVGTILLKLGVGHGSTVLECGTGSGGLTTALAWMVGTTGKVYTYEREARFSAQARYNLARAGLVDRVELKVRNLDEEDFVERGVSAAFLDVREPPTVIPKVAQALMPGGVLGFLLPTMNQVCDVLTALSSGPWVDTEVLETLWRRFKVNPARLRPEDRMIGHTGYLVFTRRIVPTEAFTPQVKLRNIPIHLRRPAQDPAAELSPEEPAPVTDLEADTLEESTEPLDG